MERHVLRSGPIIAMPAQFDPSRPFTSVLDDEINRLTNPASRAGAPVFDPSKPFTAVETSTAGPVFDPAKPFTAVDDFYSRPGNELFQDEKFDPRAYFAQNPDVAKDPAQLQKLLDVYRARRERGITTGAVKEALKSAPATGVKFAKGAAKLASNVFEFSGLQPLFNKAASVVTGDIFDKQKREALDTESDNRATKALAEFQAGTELSATGIADLGRTGVRKFLGKSVRNLSDQELLAQLSEDVSFQTQLSEIQQGRGESLKNAGLDAETLAKQGIQLDPEAIENLSLVDPATVIATAGIFKVVGVGGRQLATAGTRQAATKVASALNTVAKNVAGKTVEGAGKVVTGAARATGAAIGSVPEVAAEAVGAGIGLSKGGLGGAYVGAKAAQAASTSCP